MARKNDNAKPKPKVRRASGKGRPRNPTDKPRGKRPTTPADDHDAVSLRLAGGDGARLDRGRAVDVDVVVSRSIMVRPSGPRRPGPIGHG
jgi:hypothetical protein